MPFVGISPFFRTQQYASSLPHCLQTCTILSILAFPCPSLTILFSHPGQAWRSNVLESAFAPVLVGCSTTVTQVSLHFGQDITTMSPGLTASASATVAIGLS